MDYATLKFIHVGAVIAAFCGFVARGVGLFLAAPWVRHHITRRLADLIDTLLLFSAIGMLWVAHLSPWPQPWLRAKIIGLLVYICLGLVALRPARGAGAPRPGAINLVAWFAALGVFGYIVSVALTKSPTGAFAWLHA